MFLTAFDIRQRLSNIHRLCFCYNRFLKMSVENADPAQSCASSQFIHCSCKAHLVKVYFDKMCPWRCSVAKNWAVMETARCRDAAAGRTGPVVPSDLDSHFPSEIWEGQRNPLFPESLLTFSFFYFFSLHFCSLVSVTCGGDRVGSGRTVVFLEISSFSLRVLCNSEQESGANFSLFSGDGAHEHLSCVAARPLQRA